MDRATRHRYRRPSSLGRRGVLLLLGLLLGPAILLFVGRTVPAIDPVLESVIFHVIVVSAISGCALIVAVATALSAAKDRRPASVLLALGCVGVGFLMLAHGLTTPGTLGQPMNLWVGRLGALALAWFALCLAAAVTDRHPVARLVARLPGPALVLPVIGLATLCTWIVVDPTGLAGSTPVSGEDQIRTVVLAASAISLLATGAAHWRRWRFSRDRIGLSLVFASWLAMSAILSLVFGRFWRLSWWDYHVYLLAGFAATSWAVVKESRRSRSLAGAVAGISVRDPLEQISRGHPEALDTLIGAVEAKDPYTHGHSSRVAELSTRMGIRIGLEPEALRALHQGANLHDVGKISVPDRILNKPGSLDPEEWASIEMHPVIGWELANRAPSLRHSLSAIRYHHERWDGTGYPDKLVGADIPLAGRIVAVADVWDALTSDRAYRPAWALDRAVSHLVAGEGVLFDPLCIEAFLDVLKDEGIAPDRVRPDLDAIFNRASECHTVEERRPRNSANPVDA